MIIIELIVGNYIALRYVSTPCCCLGGCWAAIGGVVRGTDTDDEPDLSSLMVDSSNPEMTSQVNL